NEAQDLVPLHLDVGPEEPGGDRNEEDAGREEEEALGLERVTAHREEKQDRAGRQKLRNALELDGALAREIDHLEGPEPLGGLDPALQAVLLGKPARLAADLGVILHFLFGLAVSLSDRLGVPVGDDDAEAAGY